MTYRALDTIVLDRDLTTGCAREILAPSWKSTDRTASRWSS